MYTKIISLASATALLALTATASAGPFSVSSSEIIAPPAPTESVGYRHYGWHRGWHVGWHRGWHSHPRYSYAYPYYYPYAYGAGAGLATLAATPLPASGDYCATPIKTCLLYESGWLGTGCSCKVPGGIARGTVVQ